MSSNRDDFSEATKRALAGRAGHRCSIYKTPTIGPSDESPTAFMNVGIASHITAAAPGQGARRYDPLLTPEQRSGILIDLRSAQTSTTGRQPAEEVNRRKVEFAVNGILQIQFS